MKTQLSELVSPLGRLQIEVCADGMIRSLMICAGNESVQKNESCPKEPESQRAEQQLHSFFAGRLHQFDLPIDFSGYSPFAVKVLQVLQSVPFAETVSYKQLAVMAGHPTAARAVGRVVGINRTPILIPCHRVVGSSGALVGYSATGGLATKRWLLDFEKRVIKGGAQDLSASV
jgi:methylated-DNA-[protein]-cysteine S-methyltransferase